MSKITTVDSKGRITLGVSNTADAYHAIQNDDGSFYLEPIHLTEVPKYSPESFPLRGIYVTGVGSARKPPIVTIYSQPPGQWSEILAKLAGEFKVPVVIQGVSGWAGALADAVSAAGVEVVTIKELG